MMSKKTTTKFLLILIVLIFFNFNLYANNKIPIKDLQKFINIIEHIKKFYIKDINNNILFEKAITGILGKLDPHSRYMNKKEFSFLKENSIGKINGLGIEIIIEKSGLVRIIKINKSSISHNIGIKTGDLIISLDNIFIKGLNIDEIIKIMKNDINKFLKIDVYRKIGRTKKIYEFKIKRQEIDINSIYYNLLNHNLGYIKIIKFRENTPNQLKKAISILKEKNDNKILGLIIDVRNNPGGLLKSSVEISNYFLERKKLKHNKYIVFTKSRSKKNNLKRFVTNIDIIKNIPIVVLINASSASASEILAGALQDHNRALIIGNKSFGKGSVQTILPITNNCGLKLTTSLYYTPKGNLIQSIGIIPDIYVPYLELKKKDIINNNIYVIREISLSQYLKGNKYYNIIKKYNIKLINFDYQLYEACNILKGLSVWSNN